MGSSVVVRRSTRWRLRPAAAYVAIFAVAYAARLLVPLMGGGLTGFNGYDSGVYYASGDALTHGLLPYRDFVLVHPPLISYLLAPFAAVGQMTSDSVGFAAATLAFIGLGALNAGLVVAVVRRWGGTLVSATTSGLVYALCYAAIDAEFLARLEPPGNTLLLLALLALAPGADRRRPRHPLLAGLALGADVSLKIWWGLPAIVLLAIVIIGARRGGRAWLPGCWMLLGGVGAAVALNIVPFLADPHDMVQLVLGQQFARHHDDSHALRRLAHVVGMGGGIHQPVTLFTAIVAGVGLALLAWTMARGVRNPLGVMVAPLLLVQIATIVLSPSWYPFYADYTTVALTLCIGAAIDARPRSPSGLRLSPALAAAVGMIALGVDAMITLAPAAVAPVANLPRMADTTAGVPCVMSRNPETLILTNTLDRSFEAGCRNWIDTIGLALDDDKVPHLRLLPHVRDGEWPTVLDNYLYSGQALIIPNAERPLPGLQARLRHTPILARDRAMTIYRTAAGTRRFLTVPARGPVFAPRRSAARP